MQIQLTGHAVPRHPGARCDDAWAARERDGVVVAAVADGVSASKLGGVAAQRAVEMIVDYCLARPRAWSPRRALAEFTTQINRHLHAEAIERHGQPELTCTLSVVLLEGGRMYGCNVGDSPIFHWRQGRLLRLSTAHTLDDPALSHVLTRAIGLEAGVDPHFFETDLRNGDLVLLCSDGVTGALSDERVAELLSRRPAARTIVAAARSAIEENEDLSDDVSAVMLDLAELGEMASTARERLEVLPSLHAGDTVDGYRLVKPLAANERVWVAEDAAGARAVLKFPARDAAEVEALRDAFVREAWNATRLRSPDLVRAWMPEAAAVHCYAMEYLEAPTLRALLRRGRLPVEAARTLGQFLLRVGEFLVRHDLAHGDIKPENILVRRDGDRFEFRLLDLGSAAALFSVRSRAGTASYLAPERFHGGAISERTEIFALGVTLYEALTGHYPYGEIERFQTPRFEPAPRPPTCLNPAVPTWLESIVLRAVAANPETRYQCFSEMAYDLDNPERVTAHHAKNAPLLDRNPLLFFKVLSLVLFVLNLVLLALLAGKR
jgi:serine/threonine protein phosphatase PrpC